MVAFCRPEVGSVVAAMGEAIRRVTLRSTNAPHSAVIRDAKDEDGDDNQVAMNGGIHEEREKRRHAYGDEGRVHEQPWDAHAAHARVRTFYDWEEVARRTEGVYDAVMRSEPISLWERITRLFSPLHVLVKLC